MKIICIGRNYAEHAKELNNAVPTEPVFFMKPDTALLIRNRPFYYPGFTNDLHYECELVLRICKLGRHISEKFVHTYYDAIGIGIDFTARDLQQKAKEKGLPWEKAKAFDFSAPVSKFVPVKEFPDLNSISFSLQLNGITVQEGLPWEKAKAFDFSAPVSKFVPVKEFPDLNSISFSLQLNGITVQEGNSKEMIFSFDKIISYVSQFVTLRTGDYIFTGTPAGVGPVKIGDRLEAFLEGKKLLSFEVK